MPMIPLLALREVCEWSTCLASPTEHRLSTVFTYGFWSFTMPFPFTILLALLLPLTVHAGRSQGCRGFRSLRIVCDARVRMHMHVYIMMYTHTYVYG